MKTWSDSVYNFKFSIFFLLFRYQFHNAFCSDDKYGNRDTFLQVELFTGSIIVYIHGILTVNLLFRVISFFPYFWFPPSPLFFILFPTSHFYNCFLIMYYKKKIIRLCICFSPFLRFSLRPTSYTWLIFTFSYTVNIYFPYCKQTYITFTIRYWLIAV